MSQTAEAILSPDALAFVEKLHRKFNSRRLELLERRKQVQKKIDQGFNPDFLKETQSIRDGEWKVAPAPKDLLDRRVEITGPVDRKMVINALNSGARAFMADFEDSHSPTWTGTLEGQQNLFDAVRRTITYQSPEGKNYSLGEKLAVLIVRPRGFHLDERHVIVDGMPTSGSFFDFGVFLFNNAKELLKRGSGPYFYLPKMESHLEARLWAEVFAFSESELGLSSGTIRATVLIETILAAFEMDEILYELRHWIVGLNCGRWDYIFSFIKKFRNRSEFLFPDRAQVTMETHFLSSYCKLLIKTCHRRGAHAMGGMAAQIPNKSDVELNRQATEKVKADKTREVKLGHDGTWVSHPGFVALATAVFDEQMKGPNQLDRSLSDIQVTAQDLLTCPKGEITEKGLRTNINVALLYMDAWLAGTGCVPLYGLMEDAATAEISRAQVWQWIRHPEAKIAGLGKITLPMVLKILDEEFQKSKGSRLSLAKELLVKSFSEDEFSEFLTLGAYSHLN